jgi:hypothetical protein
MKSYIYGVQGIMDFMGMDLQFDRILSFLSKILKDIF